MEKSTILLDSKTLATGDLYFLQSIDQIESHFSTSATTGLSLDSIESLQAQYGLNELNSNNGVSVWSILAAQVFNAQVLVLILACIVSLGIRASYFRSASNTEKKKTLKLIFFYISVLDRIWSNWSRCYCECYRWILLRTWCRQEYGLVKIASFSKCSCYSKWYINIDTNSRSLRW